MGRGGGGGLAASAEYNFAARVVARLYGEANLCKWGVEGAEGPWTINTVTKARRYPFHIEQK